MSSLLILVY